jgi:hypothetical protein
MNAWRDDRRCLIFVVMIFCRAENACGVYYADLREQGD